MKLKRIGRYLNKSKLSKKHLHIPSGGVKGGGYEVCINYLSYCGVFWSHWIYCRNYQMASGMEKSQKNA